ncbi:MAG: hypothetical protein JHC65_09255 [Ilumatobacteraceae bacterium]|nr:hypothetical protein [Ilumatobacteraceae bacterium]
MGAQIPGVIGDVDAAWLKSELGWDVDSMDVQQIGAGSFRPGTTVHPHWSSTYGAEPSSTPQ